MDFVRRDNIDDNDDDTAWKGGGLFGHELGSGVIELVSSTVLPFLMQQDEPYRPFKCILNLVAVGHVVSTMFNHSKPTKGSPSSRHVGYLDNSL